MARALMFQGTGSDVGKSLIVAGLCRLLTRRGYRVRPFKPQNMSNNAAVTADGGEIGRAQALQARACGVLPSVHMNPVLLKPQSETGSQVIVQGRMRGSVKAAAFQAMKPDLMPAVLESFANLSREADFVLVEGAGSASEVNLRDGDIANMGFARAANVPVILIGDIDRGGVIASLVGTQVVLDPADAAMIRGFLVNRMRGDASLFASGMTFVEKRTGWPAIGLVPWFDQALRLPAEDSLGLRGSARTARTRIKIAVPVLPFIANFDDLDALRLEPEVELVLVRDGQAMPEDADLILLPGSKATIADLATLRRRHWDAQIVAHAQRGGRVLGLCGGYQMLGRSISDPEGIEGEPGAVQGLGLLDVETILTTDKTLSEVRGIDPRTGAPVSGYEMHVGRTIGPGTKAPFLVLEGGVFEGAGAADGQICGTYLHGLFDAAEWRAGFIRRLGGQSDGIDHTARIESTLDALATHLEAHLAIDTLIALASPEKI